MAVKHLNEVLDPQRVPQSEPLPDQVANSAGGFAFAVNDLTRLDRFLILGSEGGSYYATERDLTKENVAAISRLANGPIDEAERAIARIVDISRTGRAPKTDPALFALAVFASSKIPVVRSFALDALPKVARIGTHLLHFAAFVNAQRGWGPALRRAFRAWYEALDERKLAYQVLKYQGRDGWTHKDLYHLAHMRGASDTIRGQIQYWVEKGWPGVGDTEHPIAEMAQIWAFERAKQLQASDPNDRDTLIKLITDHRLTHEMVPNDFKNFPEVWEALLQEMPVNATVRQLGKLTQVGLVKPLSDATTLIVKRLADIDAIKRSRLHPFNVLLALTTYGAGQGVKGKLTWTPVPQIQAALDKAFYTTFVNAPITGKKFYIGLDVSGSMGTSKIAGSHISAREASSAMCLVTARTEPAVHIAAFTSGGRGYSSRGGAELQPLTFHPMCSLQDVVKSTAAMDFGGTDCALPMLNAIENKMEVDCFVIYTDSETWAGNIHPCEALRRYRDKMGRDAKLVVVGMTSNGFTIADPNDAGSLDVVGFDAAVPQILADFAGNGVTLRHMPVADE
jgi:60 kDa SS-A/Ro ribonucleoprotein